jgi:L-galactose dehydrogenase
METTTLGRTGLNVSVACLGCGGRSRLGQTTGASFAESVSLVEAALDAGVTIIDTAAAYGTEAIVGAAVKGRRDAVVISTKLTLGKEGAFGEGIIDGAEVGRRLHDSLAALGTDYVDILHLHGVALDQYDHCYNELLPALLACRDAGKVRFIGVTERFQVDPAHAMLERALQDGAWDVVMVGLNFVNQTALRSVLPSAEGRGVGTMCMFAVRGPLANAGAARELIDALLKTGEVDRSMIDPDDPFGFVTADGAATSLADAAYRFCRHSPGIDTILTGTGSKKHLEENLRSIAAGPLPSPVRERLACIFGGVSSAVFGS